MVCSADQNQNKSRDLSDVTLLKSQERWTILQFIGSFV